MFTIDETKAWWRGLLKDRTRFEAWLQKLHRTEFEGYTGHLQFLAQPSSADVTERTAQILLNIAMDELKHARLIEGFMANQGLAVIPDPPQSQYWKTMNSQVNGFNDYLAVNYLGEDLAATRFEIILGMPETPKEFGQALTLILPDEQFHRETLKRLAGEEAIKRMSATHVQAVTALKVET